MWRIAGAVLGVGVAVLWAGTSVAQIIATRNTSFQYEAGSGLLTQEVIEPGTSLRLQKDYPTTASATRPAFW